MTRDYLKAGAMVAALVTMAPAEYQLGHACGFGQLAAGLPASLDIYTLRAIRTGREVPAVALVMIAVNAASHLIAAGLLAVSWYLVIAVSALPVLVLVRVHALGEQAPVPQPETPVPPRSEPVPRLPALGPDLPLLQPFVWHPLHPPLPAGTGFEQGEPARTVPAARTGTGRVTAAVPDPGDSTTDTRFDEHVRQARTWLRDEPGLTGTAIGTRLGTGGSYGRRVRRAALTAVPQ